MFDMYDDNFALLMSKYPNYDDVPVYIKGAEIPAYSHEKQASNDFAVTVPLVNGVRRAFPIMSDAATGLSVMYFEDYHRNLSPELQKVAAASLKAACERFGIIVDPRSKVAELSTDYHPKNESANQRRIAFPDQGIAGTSWFPLSTEEQVKTASENFDQIIAKLAPVERREFSVRLLHKAAQFEVQLPKKVELWGGDRLSKVATMYAIEQRARFMTEDQMSLLRKSAEAIVGLGYDKVAELLEGIDRDLGIDVLWGRQIPDPQAIHETSPATIEMAKIADGVELPMPIWQQACDAGVLSALAPAVQSALRRNPDALRQWEGTPIQEHILNGLEGLELLTRTAGLNGDTFSLRV